MTADDSVSNDLRHWKHLAQPTGRGSNDDKPVLRRVLTGELAVREWEQKHGHLRAPGLGPFFGLGLDFIIFDGFQDCVVK